MRTKVFEVRDRATFIPVVATNMNPYTKLGDLEVYANQRYLLKRAGYSCDGRPIILLANASGGKAYYDPFDWGSNPRTYGVAHEYIQEHWNELKDGDVIDVEFILGETKERKVSERLDSPLY